MIYRSVFAQAKTMTKNGKNAKRNWIKSGYSYSLGNRLSRDPHNPFALSAPIFASALPPSRNQCDPEGKPCERSAQIAISLTCAVDKISKERESEEERERGDLCRKRVTHIIFFFLSIFFLHLKKWVGGRAQSEELATGSRLGFSTWLSFCVRIRLILRSVQKVKNNWTLCEWERDRERESTHVIVWDWGIDKGCGRVAIEFNSFVVYLLVSEPGQRSTFLTGAK